MSQEKVNKYKEEKANRKEIMKKEKNKRTVRRVVAGVCGVVLAVWLGYSAVNVYQNSRPREAVEVNYDALTEYQQELVAE